MNIKKIKCISSGKNQAREQEKVISVNELGHKYSLKELLKLAEMPRTTFYYYLKNLKKEDKYKEIKEEIFSIF